MKIKKKTGLLLTATAAVAAVGIAAVSFAAWNGSNTTLTAQAATGEAYLFGFTSDQSAANLKLGTLVPYDQDADTIKNGDTIVSVKIPEFVVYGDYTVTVSVTSSIDFYVLVGAEQTAVSTGAPSDWAGWKKANDGAEFTVTSSATTVTDKYLSVVMVSNNTEDMKQSNIGFTVVLSADAS